MSNIVQHFVLTMLQVCFKVFLTMSHCLMVVSKNISTMFPFSFNGVSDIFKYISSVLCFFQCFKEVQGNLNLIQNTDKLLKIVKIHPRLFIWNLLEVENILSQWHWPWKHFWTKSFLGCLRILDFAVLSISASASCSM